LGPQMPQRGQGGGRLSGVQLGPQIGTQGGPGSLQGGPGSLQGGPGIIQGGVQLGPQVQGGVRVGPQISPFGVGAYPNVYGNTRPCVFFFLAFRRF
jgi:hypothetical protein